MRPFRRCSWSIQNAHHALSLQTSRRWIIFTSSLVWMGLMTEAKPTDSKWIQLHFHRNLIDYLIWIGILTKEKHSIRIENVITPIWNTKHIRKKESSAIIINKLKIAPECRQHRRKLYVELLLEFVQTQNIQIVCELSHVESSCVELGRVMCKVCVKLVGDK